MRRVWHIATKELLQTRRDRLAALFTVVLPVVFTVFLGMLIGGADESTTSLPMAITNADGTPSASRLVERLKSSPLIDVQDMTAEDMETAIRDQEVAAGLVIPLGYEEALDAGRRVALTFVRVGVSTGAQSIWQALQTSVAGINAEILAGATAAEQVSMLSGQPLDTALRQSADTLAAAQLAVPAVTVKVTDSGNAGLRQIGGFDQASTGSLVNWALFSLLTVATGLAWERRRGLLRRLRGAGARGAEVIGGKMLAMVILTFAQELFLVLLGQLAFGVDYLSSPAALVMVMVSLAFLAASIGLLISSVFRSEQAIIAATVISAQLLAALGGAWFPLEITSATFSRAAHFLPTAWVVDSLHGIILKSWGPDDVLGPLGIVWVWIVVLLALAVWRFRPD